MKGFKGRSEVPTLHHFGPYRDGLKLEHLLKSKEILQPSKPVLGVDFLVDTHLNCGSDATGNCKIHFPYR